MSAVIEVEHLSKHFGEIRAVEDLSFQVQQGRIYAFLGQNGAGKSTTIRMLLTLIKPTAGEIKIFGMNLATHRREILEQTGAVIERPDLYKYLSGYENISLFSKMNGLRLSRQALMDQLEMVGLASRASSKVKTYSLGMKQRLGIAIALVGNPPLVILDEPTNGLDPQGIADIRNLILHLSRKEKKTILVSSHLLSEMELLADDILIVDKGHKIMEGSVQELFDPAQIVLELQAVDPKIAGEVIGRSPWKSQLEKQFSDVFIFKIDKKDTAALNRYLVENGVDLLAIRPRHSLEDYFLSLTSANQHVEAFTD